MRACWSARGQGSGRQERARERTDDQQRERAADAESNDPGAVQVPPARASCQDDRGRTKPPAGHHRKRDLGPSPRRIVQRGIADRIIQQGVAIDDVKIDAGRLLELELEVELAAAFEAVVPRSNPALAVVRP